ncbi:MAG: aminotransferase class I/II-fold pyridoxal phosphate-dependent enzyme, partial [Halobacteriales archaeon]|nr:aminotransferase class I/II-fold pyridoxal phosphate-dependent enzyme [Halobacteriales archaeon]
MVSDRATSTTPFAAMSVLERASELDDVVHLELGEPDFQPPREAVEAAVAAIRDGHSGYTNSRGKADLREAIVAYYDRRYGVDIDADRLVVTPGTSPALLLVYLSLLNPGDEAVLTDPYYACYPNFVRQAGGRISTVPLDVSSGFAPDIDAFERVVGPDTGAVMLNSPANPTGAVL